MYPRNPKIFFLIPAYNESKVIGDVVRSVKSEFEDVVVIDDGSIDQTSQKAQEAGAVVLKHLMNRGQGAALKTGIDYALCEGADILVTFDSDGQHQLDDAKNMISQILTGRYDVILGSRFLYKDNQIPWLRRGVLKLGTVFTCLVSGIKVTDTHNGLRVLLRSAAEQMLIQQDRMAHASEILDEIGRLKLRYCEFPTRIVYTDYSKQKGQNSLNAFRILRDFLIQKLGG
ncbi:MAG: glycosyltransferase family 2 protein [Candidatus Omnitrophica bacterium]|nr:glycosyltransferase family 2 protein [Candidatus Omnitrophota bacterium]